jgi:predicted small lipoprotein YifL
MRRIVALGALALLLVACGRVGPISPPGPPDQVTWPRVYPSR